MDASALAVARLNESRRVRAQPMLLPSEALPALVERAISVLRANEPPEGYYGCFSGGKDSVCVKEVTRLAGVKAVWHYNVTTIDPPSWSASFVSITPT